MTIQEERQHLIDQLGREFTPLEHVMFELYGNDVDCAVWVQDSVLNYRIKDKINFVK